MKEQQSTKYTESSIENSSRSITGDINNMQAAHLRVKKEFGAVRFGHKKIQKMYETGENTCKLTPSVYENFFEKMQILVTAKNKRDLHEYKSLGFHQLKKGRLAGKYAVWLTGNWRLIVELIEEQQSQYILIHNILDYH